MEPRFTNPVAKVVAMSTSFQAILPQNTGMNSSPSHRPNTGQAISHGLARSPLFPDELCEMTNIFSLYMYTCLNPSHIKACFCITHTGIDPEVYISTNQASFGENSDGLGRCVARIHKICRMLSETTKNTAFDTRDEILRIAINENWCKVGSRFGLHVSANLKECTNFTKDIKIGAYLPDKLRDMADSISAKYNAKNNRYKTLTKDMRQLAQMLGDIFELNAPEQYKCQVRRRKFIRKGDNVTPEGQLRAVLAVYNFHKTHGDKLWDVVGRGGFGPKSKIGSAAECKQKFTGICQYVDGATFLCNLVVRQEEAESSTGATTTSIDNAIRSWLRYVAVRDFQLPKEAFLCDGQPHPKHIKQVPKSPRAGQPQHSGGAIYTRDRTPDRALSPAPSDSDYRKTTANPKPDLQAQRFRTTSLDDVIGNLAEHLGSPYRILLDGHIDFQTTRKDFDAAYVNALGLKSKPVPKIHAEISLLVAAEILQAELEERGISLPELYFGSFKKSCYCCEQFMRASKLAIVKCQSHSKVYPSWRAPDHPYLQNLLPHGNCNAANWHHNFCDEMWETLDAAVVAANSPSMSHNVPQKVTEDIQLHTFSSIEAAAYSSDTWLGSSSVMDQVLLLLASTTLPTDRKSVV